MKEVELGKVFINYLQDQGYEVYQEVCLGYWGNNRTIDIVAKMNSRIICFELKTTLNLEVLAQAEKNKQYCHFSYVVVPSDKSYNASKGRVFATRICRDYGIGLYTVNLKDNIITQNVYARLNRKISKLALHEMQKTFAEAGNSKGKKFTPFQATIMEIFNYLKLYEPKTPKFQYVIQQINHHYSSDSTAVNSIRKWIKEGVIKCLRLDRGIISINPNYKRGEDIYDESIRKDFEE